jgi:hypothetical protein
VIIEMPMNDMNVKNSRSGPERGAKSLVPTVVMLSPAM